MLSVVIPAYNEGYVIRETLCQTIEALEAGVGDFELVVVDDGSSDDTVSIVAEQMASDERIRLVSYETNRGKGYAIRTGLAEVRGDTVAIFDADLDIAPSCISRLYDQLVSGRYDGVIGSKMHAESSADPAFIRRFVTKLSIAAVGILFRIPFRDTQVGLKIFRKAAIDPIIPRLSVDRFILDIEILYWAHRKGLRIVEGPVTINRSGSVSNVTLAAVIHSAADVLRLFVRTRFASNIDA